MLPGEAPGRGAPGRGAPGRGAGGRGMGRSAGCAEENGLLPTRGVRTPGLGAGPGRAPGAMPGWGAGELGGWPSGGVAGCPGCGAFGGAGVAVAADGRGVARVGDVAVLPESAALSGATAVGAPLPAALAIALSRAWSRDWSAALPPSVPGTATGALAAARSGPFSGPLAGALSGAGLAPPNDSRSRRATGASTVDDADLTNSPCSLSRASTSLLVTPSSLANSCTRALPATTSPVYEATTVVGRASGLAMTHCHRDFTVCSCSLLPVLLLSGKPTDVFDHR